MIRFDTGYAIASAMMLKYLYELKDQIVFDEKFCFQNGFWAGRIMIVRETFYIKSESRYLLIYIDLQAHHLGYIITANTWRTIKKKARKIINDYKKLNDTNHEQIEPDISGETKEEA